ncbi:MAG: hypothetical protein AVDCRST_MAG54-140, partial [uncultured Actinomycetospora sp.]
CAPATPPSPPSRPRSATAPRRRSAVPLAASWGRRRGPCAPVPATRRTCSSGR